MQICMAIVKLLEREGDLTFEEIQRWYRTTEFYNNSDLNPRTFYRYRKDINQMDPYSIEVVEKIYYHLEISDVNKDNIGLYNLWTSSFDIQSIWTLAKKHSDCIKLLDAPTGIGNVKKILEAIDNNKGVECDYESFERNTTKHHVLIPYFLRTWEQRWYLVAELAGNKHKTMSIFALERMKKVMLTKENHLRSHNMTKDEYFKGSFGTNHSDAQQPERIRIKVPVLQVGYIRNLPIHESQQEVKTTEDYSIFEYEIMPCYSLYQELLWQTDKIEVLEPQHVREELGRLARNIAEKYRDN